MIFVSFHLFLIKFGGAYDPIFGNAEEVCKGLPFLSRSPVLISSIKVIKHSRNLDWEQLKYSSLNVDKQYSLFSSAAVFPLHTNN